MDMKTRLAAYALAVTLVAIDSAQAQSGNTVPVTADKDVPVDGFWSITVYNKEGYLQRNEYDADSLNNITASQDADGSVAVQFGGCDGKIANCLPIAPGWNYWVRLYRPRVEILNGTWKFPPPEPVT
jgi:hypothetical protein